MYDVKREVHERKVMQWGSPKHSLLVNLHAEQFSNE